MCCFSQPVISVSATNIFARPTDAGRQFLVYSMTLNTDKELAMVLPVPVKVGSDENAVTFIDLSGYRDFFEDLLKGFPDPPTKSTRSKGVGLTPVSGQALKIVSVGSFEASFVPTVKDFSRLDERFRISDEAWKKLPSYSDYGFAVFKLKPGEAKIHPMAFSFPRRNTKSLFFPTVHIHDGEVHGKAEFDHVLYCQPSQLEHPEIHDWRESHANAGRFVKLDKAKGLILGDLHCYQKQLRGMLPNHDTTMSTFN